jgi:hypothetical protein
MNNITSRQASVLIALCAASLCFAQTPAPPPAKSHADTAKIDFVTVDKDESGSITKEETKVIADLDAAFDQLDANQDRSVSPAEFSRWSRAGKTTAEPPDPATAPRGSAGSQHMPDAD